MAVTASPKPPKEPSTCAAGPSSQSRLGGKDSEGEDSKGQDGRRRRSQRGRSQKAIPKQKIPKEMPKEKIPYGRMAKERRSHIKKTRRGDQRADIAPRSQ